ncbi:MAG: hypothetical protein AWU59_179 [Methanolobus sp. T82-4]|jgi:hypothetical protein|nr:MAG: hypothetical protein AWU59_179 [Methanolobus sp. T82-4]
MKIREKNTILPCNILPYNDFQYFRNNDRAWIDLILSKTALIFASIIILAALYHLSADFQQADKQRQLDAIAQDFRSAIDSAGQSPHGTSSSNISYSFDAYGPEGQFTGQPDAWVSGEYVGMSYGENNRTIYAVKPLTYKTLPYNETIMRNKLLNRFSASGELADPIVSPFTYLNVSDFLTTLGTKEKNLNTSAKVHIVKTLIHVQNGTEVRELEYVLVYQ